MDSFEAENFRSLKHLKLDKLARVNLLVGKNNSGKTSVLECIYMLVNIQDAEWFEVLNNIRGMEENEQDLRSLFYGFNINHAIDVYANYREAGNGPRKLRVQLEPVNDIQARRRKGLRKLLIKITIGARGPVLDFNMSPLSDTGMYYEPESEESVEFLEGGLPNKMSARHANEFLATGVNLDQLSQNISSLTINKEEDKLVSVLKQIDERINSFSLDTKGQIYFDLGNNFGMLSSINLMGEGIQRLLSVVASIANNSGGIIFIDEVDNGLHYSALRILWKGIMQAAREYDVQVFATTHSAEALRHLTWVLDDDEYKDYRNDIAAYTLIRAKDDTVRSYRYDYEQLDFAMEHDIEVRN